MKGNIRKIARSIVVVSAIAVTSSAHAGLPVWDFPNFVVNLVNKHTLLRIEKHLEGKDKGSVIYNIDQSTNESTRITTLNYTIDNDFTWIIGNNDEDIDIPKEITDKLSSVMGDQSSAAYTAHFKTASAYEDPAKFTSDTLFEGSRARKAANDALVELVAYSQEQLGEETEALREIVKRIPKAQGTGHQMQVANALAGSQLAHLIKMRSTMLVSEASHAADAQVAADKDARAIAVSKRLSEGLSTAVAPKAASLSAY